jgi:hypothetical protein
MSIAGIEKLNELRQGASTFEHPPKRWETEPAAEPIEQTVHFAAEGLPNIGEGGLRRRRLLYFDRYLCHR